MDLNSLNEILNKAENITESDDLDDYKQYKYNHPDKVVLEIARILTKEIAPKFNGQFTRKMLKDGLKEIYKNYADDLIEDALNVYFFSNIEFNEQGKAYNIDTGELYEIS